MKQAHHKQTIEESADENCIGGENKQRLAALRCCLKEDVLHNFKHN